MLLSGAIRAGLDGYGWGLHPWCLPKSPAPKPRWVLRLGITYGWGLYFLELLRNGGWLLSHIPSTSGSTVETFCCLGPHRLIQQSRQGVRQPHGTLLGRAQPWRQFLPTLQGGPCSWASYRLSWEEASCKESSSPIRAKDGAPGKAGSPLPCSTMQGAAHRTEVQGTSGRANKQRPA